MSAERHQKKKKPLKGCLKDNVHGGQFRNPTLGTRQQAKWKMRPRGGGGHEEGKSRNKTSRRKFLAVDGKWKRDGRGERRNEKSRWLAVRRGRESLRRRGFEKGMAGKSERAKTPKDRIEARGNKKGRNCGWLIK